MHRDFALYDSNRNSTTACVFRQLIFYCQLCVLRTVSLFLAVTLASAIPASAELIPSDLYFATHQWSAATIGLPQAWMHTTGSAAIKIAVLDTGVISTTPDLSGRLDTASSATSAAPFTDAALMGSSVLRHGTHVASVAAMGVNNAIGGAGVGNFTILPITVTNAAANNSSAWIAAGIRAAADAGARVINVSQGTLTYGGLDDAAAYARSLGALTFVAAGNSDSRIDRGNFPNLIFVAGTNQTDGRWTNGTGVGSTWGPFVDLSAPAQDILVADPTLANGYGTGSGTSFAAPLASGVAGLVWSINPNLSPLDVEQILFTSSVDLGTPGWDEVYGHGRIDAGAAVAMTVAGVPEPAGILLVAIAALAMWRRRCWC